MDDRLEKVLISPQMPGSARLTGREPKRKNYIPVALLILSLIFWGGFYFFREWKNGRAINASRDIEVKSDSQTLIEEVSKLISLPQDEEPTIATVSDPKLLKDQAFFANAKVGDKVLIYTKAKKAILYDPVNKKIMEVAPLNIKGK